MNDMSTMSETEFEEFKSRLKGLLHDQDIKDLHITFTKADGTERRMRCTLIESAIPSDKTPKGTGRVAPDTTQRVFDLDRGEWRSFKWESVKNVEFTTGE